MSNNYKDESEITDADDEELCSLKADIEFAFEDKTNESNPPKPNQNPVEENPKPTLVVNEKLNQEIENLLAEKKLIGEKYLVGLPMNVIRYIFIPCFLAFVLYKNISALSASGYEIASLINVTSILFFSSVAVYLSFGFLKAQIALQASDSDERKSITGAFLKQIVLNNGDPDSPPILKRQGLALEFFLGLVMPTMLFILTFCVMNTLDIFAMKIGYVILAFVFVLALMNDPINSARSKPCCKAKRLH
jgi:hypothetical protein